ncbi:hypothetical protein J8273_1760 [Carpediemonas membranifera]|uniref:Coatomer subunit zeta n=1 Tax=Carpediemonas membranifera TaxID=201153 RepID=A0A8J6E670_9EUKA|nr:hypothetical protein J8273_1760 [Carpediemonas membranifera]|eukprot:KAG9396742.1 hypothetical protein J8273_1760 [Carpediemonas membranifera]
MSLFSPIICVAICDNSSRYLFAKTFGTAANDETFLTTFSKSVLSRTKKTANDGNCIYADDMMVVYRNIGSIFVVVAADIDTGNELSLSTFVEKMGNALRNLDPEGQALNRTTITSHLGQIAIMIDESVQPVANGGGMITLANPPNLAEGFASIGEGSAGTMIASGLNIAKGIGRALLR